MFFVALTFGFVLLFSTYTSFLTDGYPQNVITLAFFTTDLISTIAAFPFFVGYVYLCSNVANGNKTELSEIFKYYSSKFEIMQAYKFLIKLIPQILLKIILPLALIAFSDTYIPQICNILAINGLYTFSTFIYYFSFPLNIALLILAFRLSGNIIVKLICFCSNTQSIKYSKTGFFILRLSLIPLYVFSFLTFGSLFIAYTIPFTVVLYSIFLFNNITTTEKTLEFKAENANNFNSDII